MKEALARRPRSQDEGRQARAAADQLRRQVADLRDEVDELKGEKRRLEQQLLAGAGGGREGRGAGLNAHSASKRDHARGARGASAATAATARRWSSPRASSASVARARRRASANPRARRGGRGRGGCRVAGGCRVSRVRTVRESRRDSRTDDRDDREIGVSAVEVAAAHRVPSVRDAPPRVGPPPAADGAGAGLARSSRAGTRTAESSGSRSSRPTGGDVRERHGEGRDALGGGCDQHRVLHERRRKRAPGRGGSATRKRTPGTPRTRAWRCTTSRAGRRRRTARTGGRRSCSRTGSCGACSRTAGRRTSPKARDDARARAKAAWPYLSTNCPMILHTCHRRHYVRAFFPRERAFDSRTAGRASARVMASASARFAPETRSRSRDHRRARARPPAARRARAPSRPQHAHASRICRREAPPARVRGGRARRGRLGAPAMTDAERRVLRDESLSLGGAARSAGRHGGRGTRCDHGGRVHAAPVSLLPTPFPLRRPNAARRGFAVVRGAQRRGDRDHAFRTTLAGVLGRTRSRERWDVYVKSGAQAGRATRASAACAVGLSRRRRAGRAAGGGEHGVHVVHGARHARAADAQARRGVLPQPQTGSVRGGKRTRERRRSASRVGRAARRRRRSPPASPPPATPPRAF